MYIQIIFTLQDPEEPQKKKKKTKREKSEAGIEAGGEAPVKMIKEEKTGEADQNLGIRISPL